MKPAILIHACKYCSENTPTTTLAKGQRMKQQNEQYSAHQQKQEEISLKKVLRLGQIHTNSKLIGATAHPRYGPALLQG